jgi:hypothetical protein
MPVFAVCCFQRKIGGNIAHFERFGLSAISTIHRISFLVQVSGIAAK